VSVLDVLLTVFPEFSSVPAQRARELYSRFQNLIFRLQIFRDGLGPYPSQNYMRAVHFIASPLQGTQKTPNPCVFPLSFRARRRPRTCFAFFAKMTTPSTLCSRYFSLNTSKQCARAHRKGVRYALGTVPDYRVTSSFT